MSTQIWNRIDAMENGLVEKIRSAVAELIADVKQELDAKLLVLETRVAALESKPAPMATDDRSLNFLIYDMAESDDENTLVKVNELVSTQLLLPDVKVVETDRKPKPDGKDNGVIVVKCSDIEDKKKILEAKSRLNGLEHFKHIRIYHDKPQWQRQHEANVRLLVRSMGNHKLYVKGNRICERGNQRDN